LYVFVDVLFYYFFAGLFASFCIPLLGADVKKQIRQYVDAVANGHLTKSEIKITVA
jgi:hypothetical protein